jgi:two-component system CheB/CheR fusion protein
MAQASTSARHDSMPRSAIATGLVDFVLPAEELPAKLLEYVAHLKEVGRSQESEQQSKEIGQQLARICVVLRHQTGHDFSQYKQNTLVRRIQRRMLVLQIRSMPEYLDRLRTDRREGEALFKDLLIGVTHFFRDPEAFAALAQQVIPRLVDRAGPDGSLRLWTPGCATGEEAYSVAILLREEFARRKFEARVQIFAGDIDEEALEFARAARYPEGIAGQVAPARLERFFTHQHNSYVVNKDIRDMCIFSKHNLIKDPPFSRLDLIVCRNVLIYMESPLQQLVAELFHYALRPSGFLFLGPSENLTGPAGLFLTLDKKYRIFQRGDTLVRPRLPLSASDERGRPREQARGLDLKRGRPREAGTVELLEKILVEHFSPAWVVVNAEGVVVYYSPRTGRYLEPVGPPARTSTRWPARDCDWSCAPRCTGRSSAAKRSRATTSRSRATAACSGSTSWSGRSPSWRTPTTGST